MAIQIPHELLGPGTVKTDAGQYGNVGAGAGGAPMWEVGNPVAVAMSGLQNAVSNFADTYDDIQVSDFLLRKQQELDQKYNHPETGLFTTRRGANAQGIYSGLVDDAKRITDEDAPKELNARQRGKITKPLSTMFTQWGHTVGGFETEQLMAHQSNMIENNISMAKNLLAANGNLNTDAIGHAVAQITINTEAKGKIQGLDPETVQRMARDSTGEAITKGAIAKSVSDPTAAYGALQSYRDIIPEAMHQSAVKQIVTQWRENTKQKVFEVAENEGTKPARELLRSVSSSGRSSRRSAQEESKGDPAAVNYSDAGGISVGLYQFHKGPSFNMVNKFGEWMVQNGKPEVAKALKGLSGKELAEEWIRQVKSGNITDEEQTQFAQEAIINPTLRSLPQELQERMNNSGTYQDALWSVAIQHGQGGATKLLTRAWNDSGMDNRKFFESFYDSRKGEFPRQTANVQKNVAERFEREKKRALGELNEKGEYQRDELIMMPSETFRLNKMLDTRDKEKSSEANRLYKGLSPNGFANYVQTGGSAESVAHLDDIEAGIMQTGSAPTLLKFQTERQRYEKLMPYMRALEGQNLADQHAESLAFVNSLREQTGTGLDTVSNYAQIQKMADEVNALFAKKEAAFNKDPAGVAFQTEMSMALRDAQDSSVPPVPEKQVKDEYAEDFIPSAEQLKSASYQDYLTSGRAAQALEKNIARQQAMSSDPLFVGKVFPTEQLKRYKDAFAHPDIPKQYKYELASSLVLATGERFNQAANELGFSGGAKFAALAVHHAGKGQEINARWLMAAALTPDDEAFGKSDDKKRSEWRDRASKLSMVVNANSVSKTMGHAGTSDAATIKNDVAKALAMGSEKEMKEFAAAFTPYSYEQWGAASWAGMRPSKANVDLYLPNNIGGNPMEKAEAIASAAGVFMDRIADVLPKEITEQGIRAIQQSATFVSIAGGTHVELYNGGASVLDANKKRIIFDINDLIKKYGGQTPAGTYKGLGGLARANAVEQGNIDLYNRPTVNMPDGSIATVRTMSFNDDGLEVNIPTIGPNGEDWSDEEAIEHYHATGEHLGKFSTVEEAEAAADQLHLDQERLYAR